MPRELPHDMQQPPQAQVKQDNGVITQIREYQVITPLFGGGVEPREADPITIVRASEVRGQLRFWWRATRGGQFSSIKDLKRAEDELWGSTTQPSLVQIDVTTTDRGYPLIPVYNDSRKSTLDNNGNPIRNFHNSALAQQLDGVSYYKAWNNRERKEEIRELRAGDPYSVDSYVAFPLRDQKETALIEGVNFTLTICIVRDWITQKSKALFTELPINELLASLWAWETFGGIGGRVRRGCGAIYCSHATQNNEPVTISRPTASEKGEVVKWLKDQLTIHLRGTSWPDAVPHLSSDLSLYGVVASFNDAMTAWRYSVDRLKQFRQLRDPGRQPGRSRWPEPEPIRRITRQRFPPHKPRPSNGKFPRAAFGLPLIFQFKDGPGRKHINKDDPQLDPRKTVLQLDGFDRLGSPLIFRPLLCRSHQPPSVVCLAVILAGSGLLDHSQRPPQLRPLFKDRLRLKSQEGSPLSSTVNPEITTTDALSITDSKGQALLDSETDVLRAFLNYLEEE